MNRPGSILIVALIPLLLVAAVYTTTALALRPASVTRAGDMPTALVPAKVTGIVVWGQLAVLSPEASVSVRLLDVSSANGGEIVLGEYLTSAVGSGYPAEFEIAYDPSTIRPGGLYAVVGDITVGDTLVYRSMTRTQVFTRGSTTSVHLFLSRVGPSSPFDDAVGSGRLARFSYN